jgi:hypothetical protein
MCRSVIHVLRSSCGDVRSPSGAHLPVRSIQSEGVVNLTHVLDSVCPGSEHEVCVSYFNLCGLETIEHSLSYEWRHYAHVCSDLSFPKTV